MTCVIMILRTTKQGHLNAWIIVSIPIKITVYVSNESINVYHVYVLWTSVILSAKILTVCSPFIYRVSKNKNEQCYDINIVSFLSII